MKFLYLIIIAIATAIIISIVVKYGLPEPQFESIASKVKEVIVQAESAVKEHISSRTADLERIVVGQGAQTRQEISKNRDEIFENRLEDLRNSNQVLGTVTSFGWIIILILIAGMMLILFTLFFGFYLVIKGVKHA